MNKSGLVLTDEIEVGFEGETHMNTLNAPQPRPNKHDGILL